MDYLSPRACSSPSTLRRTMHLQRLAAQDTRTIAETAQLSGSVQRAACPGRRKLVGAVCSYGTNDSRPAPLLDANYGQGSQQGVLRLLVGLGRVTSDWPEPPRLLQRAAATTLLRTPRLRCHPGGLDSIPPGRRPEVKHASSFDVGVVVWRQSREGRRDDTERSPPPTGTERWRLVILVACLAASVALDLPFYLTFSLALPLPYPSSWSSLSPPVPIVPVSIGCDCRCGGGRAGSTDPSASSPRSVLGQSDPDALLAFRKLLAPPGRAAARVAGRC